MKKFLSVLLAGLLVAVCVLAFAACGECEHTFGEWEIDTAVTCTADGAKHRVCTKCGEREDAVIEKTGHVFDKQVADEKYLCSGATCTAAATYCKSCACGEKGSETFTHGEALGHDYNDITGVCARCGHNASRTLTVSDNGYNYFIPVGNKIFLNFTVVEEHGAYFDNERMMGYDEITNETPCSVTDLRIYTKNDLEHPVEMDEHAIEPGDTYFWWKTEEAFAPGTEVYVTVTLDGEYEWYALYVDAVSKPSAGQILVTTDTDDKLYDGEPFAVEGICAAGIPTATYFKYADGWWNPNTGTTTPPTEPGSYFARLEVETETAYSQRTYEFRIVPLAVEAGINEYYYDSVDAPEGTERTVKVPVEAGKEYAIYVESGGYTYTVCDEDGTPYDVAWDSETYYYPPITARKTGDILFKAVKVADGSASFGTQLYEVHDFDLSADNRATVLRRYYLFKVSAGTTKAMTFSCEDMKKVDCLSVYDSDMNYIDDFDDETCEGYFIWDFDIEDEGVFYVEIYINSDTPVEINVKSVERPAVPA